MRVTDDMIDSLVCPPPPLDPPIMSEEMISGLIVPAPGWSMNFRPLETPANDKCSMRHFPPFPLAGKDIFSPEAESSPAQSSLDPQNAQGIKPTSRTSSFEIENLLKTAEQVSPTRARGCVCAAFQPLWRIFRSPGSAARHRKRGNLARPARSRRRSPM